MADRVTMTFNLTQFNARIALYVRASGREADAATLHVATDVLADTVESWPVDSGESRAAWWGPKQIAPAAYQIGNPTPQAAVIEFGGWRNPGPGTHRYAGQSLPGGQDINPGVYSNKVPEAPLRRALSANYQKLGKAVAVAIKQAWGR